MIDRSWLKVHPESTRRAADFMHRLLFCSGVLWLMMTALTFLLGR